MPIPSPTDPDDWPGWVLYRIAYGRACDILDRQYDCRRGPDGATALARLRAAVHRELGEHDGQARAIIDQAVADAAEGRRPRW